jgi:septum formation protein
MVNLPKLILASGSPRRSEILTSVGWEFDKHVREIDETELPGEPAEAYVRRLAKSKAEKVAAEFPSQPVLGADTTVVLDGRIIAKPIDLDDARQMLSDLSGNWHDVLTGVALAYRGETSVGVQSTSVKFAEMTAAEIEYLVEHGSPLDKAGAYAVQAQAALFIEEIKGDYWNVVGLPVNLVYELAKKLIESEPPA